MMWTESAIAQHLDGRFYQLQQKSLGSFTVIDLNEVEEEPEPAPVRLVAVQTAKPRPDGSLWLDDIARVVCGVYGITKLEFVSERRAHKLVAARQIFYWIAKRFTSHTFPFIGAWVGRDHSTVIHGCQKIEHRFKDYATEINLCLSRLGVSLNQQEAA